MVYACLTPAIAMMLVAAPMPGQTIDQSYQPTGPLRPMITRAQLQQSLAEIQQQLDSRGYSEGLRSIKRKEAEAIKERLANGDIRVGDVIALLVGADVIFNKSYIVTPNVTIVLPRGTEISLKGKLRSEVQPFLNEKFAEMVVNPNVQATIAVRLSLEGNVGKACFACNVDPGMPLSEFLQVTGGGPGQNVALDKSRITRGGKVIIDGREFANAIRDGRTIDELNLQGGDNVFVESKPSKTGIARIVGAISGAIGLVYLATRII